MNEKKLGKFQTKVETSWKGYTSDNHLASLGLYQPNKLSQFMVELLATKRGANLETMLNRFPVMEIEDDNEYTWDIVGSYRRNIPLVEARDEDGIVITSQYASNVGMNTSPFYLVFAEDWFGDGEVIFGNLNEAYPLRILGEPRFEGSNAVYKVETFNGRSEGVPVERLLMGERFSVGYAPVERERSRKVGKVRFATPVSMRNEFSKIRIENEVSGSKLDKKLQIGVPIIDTVEGKRIKTTTNKWVHYEMYETEKQFSEYKNIVLVLGTSNRNENGEYLNIGKSGNIIQTGDGLFAQLEVSNTIYVNKPSLKLIEEYLVALSTSKLDFGSRVFVLKTGEYGAMEFNKMVMQEVSGWTAYTTQNNPATVNKTSSPLHSNALAAGFQFTEYKAPNGITIKLDIDPFYDDEVHHKIKHPEGGTAYSRRMDIFYLGNSEEQNIKRVKVKGLEDTRSIVAGIRNPYTGAYSNPTAAHDEDSASFHMTSTLGLCVFDPTRSVSFIPSVLQW